MLNEKQYEYLGTVEINGDIINIGKDKDYLYSGIVINVGFAEMDEYKIDHDESLTRNLTDFIDFLEEE